MTLGALVGGALPVGHRVRGPDEEILRSLVQNLGVREQQGVGAFRVGGKDRLEGAERLPRHRLVRIVQGEPPGRGQAPEVLPQALAGASSDDRHRLRRRDSDGEGVVQVEPAVGERPLGQRGGELLGGSCVRRRGGRVPAAAAAARASLAHVDEVREGLEPGRGVVLHESGHDPRQVVVHLDRARGIVVGLRRQGLRAGVSTEPDPAPA